MTGFRGELRNPSETLTFEEENTISNIERSWKAFQLFPIL